METISADQLKALKFFHRLPLELVQTLLNAGHIQNIPKKTCFFPAVKISKMYSFSCRGKYLSTTSPNTDSGRSCFFWGKAIF